MTNPKARARNRELRLRRTQGCLTDCIAYYFNLHPEKVPFFVYPRNGWSQRLKRFFKRRGYKAFWQGCLRPPKSGLHILCGDSLRWKTASHAVVYRDGKLVYDPKYPSEWSDKRITHRLIVKGNSHD